MTENTELEAIPKEKIERSKIIKWLVFFYIKATEYGVHVSKNPISDKLALSNTTAQVLATINAPLKEPFDNTNCRYSKATQNSLLIYKFLFLLGRQSNASNALAVASTRISLLQDVVAEYKFTRQQQQQEGEEEKQRQQQQQAVAASSQQPAASNRSSSRQQPTARGGGRHGTLFAVIEASLAKRDYRRRAVEKATSLVTDQFFE
ncbi:hypothetical protein MBANPS3_006202 [Mucor bainieri]